MNLEKLESKLRNIEQRHVLNYWEMLKDSEKRALAKQIEALDTETFLQQRKLLEHTSKETHTYIPFEGYSLEGSAEDIQIGEKLIGDGNLGCLIIAGGQGTRLKFNGPKGLFPISPIKHKTLFQLFAEKTLAAGKRYQRKLKLAIMTSSQNHDETLAYFKEHKYFGLDRAQVDFFQQNDLPFLDKKGDLILELPYKIAEGPDGNGNTLHQFVSSKIWDKWYADDIRFLNIVLIDNPLADPFDAALLGFHLRRGAEVTIKCIQRKDVEEKVGLLVGDNKSLSVIEYTEMPPEEWNAKLPNGTLKHNCANISLFCVNMEFAQQVSAKKLPLHKAYKPVKVFTEDNLSSNPEPHAWKYERYIFDILHHTQKVSALMYPREICFAPLKNAEGLASPVTVKNALWEYDRTILSKITGLQSPTWQFELSQDFHYPTKELLQKWKGKTPAPNKPFINP